MSSIYITLTIFLVQKIIIFTNHRLYIPLLIFQSIKLSNYHSYIFFIYITFSVYQTITLIYPYYPS